MATAVEFSHQHFRPEGQHNRHSGRHTARANSIVPGTVLTHSFPVVAKHAVRSQHSTRALLCRSMHEGRVGPILLIKNNRRERKHIGSVSAPVEVAISKNAISARRDPIAPRSFDRIRGHNADPPRISLDASLNSFLIRVDLSKGQIPDHLLSVQFQD